MVTVPAGMQETFKNALVCTGTGLHPEVLVPSFSQAAGSITYTSLDPAYSSGAALHWFQYDVSSGAVQSGYTATNSNCASLSMQALVAVGLARD